MTQPDPRETDPLFPAYLDDWRHIIALREGSFDTEAPLSPRGERYARTQALAAVSLPRQGNTMVSLHAPLTLHDTNHVSTPAEVCAACSDLPSGHLVPISFCAKAQANAG